MNVFVKPRQLDGQPVLVRDPTNGKPLAASGEWKSKTEFWIRRIAQGDVVDMTEQQTAAQAAAAQANPDAPVPSAALPGPTDKPDTK